jgi:hypothetical protein
VRKDDLIAYANRDWSAIAAHKRRVWTQVATKMSAAEMLALGDSLRDLVHTIHPDWPTREQRLEDLETHIRVSEMLRRAGPNHHH